MTEIVKAFERCARRYLLASENAEQAKLEVERGRELLAETLECRSKHWDQRVKHEAKRVLRGLEKGRQNFEATMAGLRRVREIDSKAKRRKGNEMLLSGEPTHDLPGGFEIRELFTVKSLQEVGRALGNCVESEGDAHEYLANRMWVLRNRKKRPLLLISIDSDGDVCDCEGHFPRPLPASLSEDERAEKHRNPEPLPPSIAREIMATTGAKSDGFGSDAFAIGGLEIFRDGVPDARPVEVDGVSYRVWIDAASDEEERRCVIAAGDGSSSWRSWSLFRIDGDRLEKGCQGQRLSVVDLLRLATKSSEIRERLD